MESRSFRIGQWNLNGMSWAGGQRLAHALEREGLDVLLACETRLSQERTATLQVPNYQVVASVTRDVHPVMPTGPGGGCMILVRPNQRYERLRSNLFLDVNLGPIEACGVRLFLYQDEHPAKASVRREDWGLEARVAPVSAVGSEGAVPAYGRSAGRLAPNQAPELPFQSFVVVSVYISPGPTVTSSHLNAFTTLLAREFGQETVLLGGDLNPTRRVEVVRTWLEEGLYLVLNDEQQGTRGESVLDYFLLQVGAYVPPMFVAMLEFRVCLCH